jgi:hypothetical protein
MSSLATRRLIDAAAKLQPAERALLNLWVNRGLDDGRLAQLTGLSPEALHTRRVLIVGRLSDELGLPPAEVEDALATIAASAGEHVALSPNGQPHTDLPAAPASANGTHPAIVTADLEPIAFTDAGAPAAGAQSGRAGAGRRRRAIWAAMAGLVLALIVVLVAVLANSGGATHRATAAKPRTTTTAAAATSPTVTAPAEPNPVTTTPKNAHIPTRLAGGPRALPLAGLPGGLGKAHGSVQLFGPLKHLRLKLRVRGLRRPNDGHYEVWLFNSIVDSRPLGRLRNGVHVVALRLPARARHYRWIDISFQPTGLVNHSGESELRASNPAHTTKARLRKHSARNRHQLRRATSGSKKAKTSK